jgi:hypothetical protein
MKKNQFLSGVVAATVLCAVSASAQFSYQNGNMIAAFGKAGASPDVIVNLGSISGFQNGGLPAFSFDLSNVITNTFGGVDGVYWSVLGVNKTTGSYDHSVTQTDKNTVWSTVGRADPLVINAFPAVIGSSAVQANAVGDIRAIGLLTTPNQANGGIIDFSPGIETVAKADGLYSYFMTDASFNGTGNLGGALGYNVLNTGVGTSDLFQSNPGDPFANTQIYLGAFSLSSAGVFTFAPVPEPSTYAMMGSGMLALLALRRRK